MIKITVSSYNNEASAQTLSAVFGPKGGTIGRSEENDFVLPDPKRYVSRTQASIKCDGERYTITNLSQASPILINGQEINFEREHILRPGDEIKIGLYLLHTEQHEEQQIASAPETAIAEVPQQHADAAQAEEIPADETASTTATDEMTPLTHEAANAGLPLENLLAGHATPAEPAEEPAAADRTDSTTDTPDTAPEDVSASVETAAAPDEHVNPETATEKAATGDESESEENAMEESANASAATPDDHIEYTPYVELPHGPIADDFDHAHIADAETEKQEQPDSSTDAIEAAAEGSSTLETAETEPQPEPDIVPRNEDPHNTNVPAEITAATGAAMSAAAAVVAELHDAPAAAAPVAADSTSTTASSSHEEVAAIAVAAAHESLPVAALQEAETEQAPALDINPVFKPATSPAQAEAPPAPAPAPATTAAPAADNINATDNSVLIQAFLKGAGIPHITVTSGLTPEFMEMIGKLMATTVQGTFDLISSRAMIKREVKADVTQIVVRNNNPLKFLPNGQAVLIQMMRKKMPGFMGPVETMQDAYEDLHAHQVGVVAGMRAAIDEVLTRFNPQQLEERLKKRSLLDAVIPQHRKAKMWDLYTDMFQDIFTEAKDDFQAVFGQAFVAAYEKEIDRFKDGKNDD